MSGLTPIVFVPGLASSLRSHLPVYSGLWRHGSVMVANQTQDDSIGAMAARVLREAPPRFVLFGHSLGGYISLEIMRQAPERVTRLALLNTQARADTPEAVERRKMQIAAVREGKFGQAMDAFFQLLVHPSRLNDAALRRELELASIDAGPDAFIRQQTAIMARIDSRPYLPAIKIPTLVLSGDQDKLISNELSREMAGLIPGATLVIIPDAGHMAPIEQPAAVSAAFDEWLKA
jgi:pimeloyl-ACP methyl ester carboxylesterase